MPQFALRWILMHDAVSCTIPGAKNPKQAQDNTAAADLPAISTEVMEQIEQIYTTRIRESVHHYW
jgi:aryl-alcohol dehydrogenase-like predicted oxidoreductase